jgi:pimeloyl-ACP methyl ester carboxylesterase
MRAGWAYFESFPKAAKEFAELAKKKLGMPVLTIGGEKANGEFLKRQVPEVATDVRSIVLKGCGHWLLEEQPEATAEALRSFL